MPDVLERDAAWLDATAETGLPRTTFPEACLWSLDGALADPNGDA